MADYLKTNDGQIEIIGCDRQFEEMIRDRIGEDAVEYMTRQYGHWIESEDPVDRACCGECTQTYAIQEEYENAILDVLFDLKRLDPMALTKSKCKQQLDEIIEKMKQI